jgi:hypothetical protein
MALTIIAGTPIETNRDDGRLWFAQNGAKRTRLTLYAAQGVHIECVDFHIPVYVARNAVPVWTGESWHREASVYLYPAETDELHAVWLNTHCGFGVSPKDAVLWEASSVGGPKNSESKIAVVELGCYIERHSYKHATPSSWYSISLDGAVRRLGTRSNIVALALRGDKDATRLAELKGWLSELITGQLEVSDA